MLLLRAGCLCKGPIVYTVYLLVYQAEVLVAIAHLPKAFWNMSLSPCWAAADVDDCGTEVCNCKCGSWK